MAQKRIAQPQQIQGAARASSANGSKSKAKKAARRKAPFLLAGIAVVLLAAAVFIADNYSKELEYRRMINDAVNRDVFYEGIVVSGVHIGGLTVEAARAKLLEREQELVGQVNLRARYEDREFAITSEDVGFTFDTDDVLRRAWEIARTGAVEDRYVQIQRVAAQGVALELTSVFDESRLRMAAARIAGQINVDAVSAEVQGFDYAAKAFVISEAVTGMRADETVLADAIVAAVKAGDLGAVVPVQVAQAEPAVTKDQLAAKMGQMGATFTTDVGGNSDRRTNVALASAAVTEYGMVMPGETFSFNQATGPRNAEQGYREAGAFRNGETVPELGGGVCQVSTTLFNALIRGGVQITERNNHSMTVGYVPLGHDAAVDHQTGKDLKFINNTASPIWLIMNFDSETRKLSAEVYGEIILEPGVTYDLDEDITDTLPRPEEPIMTIDLSLAVGTEERTDAGKDGYRVDTYLVATKDGVEQSRSFLFNSHYRASAARYKYNPGTLPSSPVIPTGLGTAIGAE